MNTAEIKELANVLICQAMNDEEGRLVVCEWDEIQEFGFDNFDADEDASSLILALWHDERVLDLWEREIENEPVLSIVV